MSTLPKFLYGSYKRYKSDTASFVEWLIQTARKCGHDATLMQSEERETKTGKRKKSKTPNPKQHKISLKELGILAQTIADSTLEIPPVILATAKRAISLRKRCATWFAAGKKDATDETDSHSHFIAVLEKLCELLERKASKPVPTSQNANVGAPSLASSGDESILQGNQFAHLTMEDSPDPKPDASHEPNEKAVEIEEDEDEDESIYSEMFFSLFCLLEDLNNMRNFILQSVQEYTNGKIDLMTVAVIADSAVRLAMQLIDEVTGAWPHIRKDGTDIQKLVYITACVARGQHPDVMPDPSLPYNSNMSDVAEWCYLPTTTLLHSFREVLQPNQLPVFKKGHFGTYNSDADRDRMKAGARFNEDKIILLELLPEFAPIQKCHIRMPVQDEITRALVNFIKTKDVPLYLCFATQVLLDVHHGLRHTKHRAYNDLRLSGIRISKTIEEDWAFSRTFSGKPRFWPIEGDEYALDLQKSIEAWVTDDVFLNGKKKVLSESMLKAGGMEKHFCCARMASCAA